MKNDTEKIAKKIRFEGSLSELRQGIKVEAEHARTIGKSLITRAKIAQDHLREHPRYYSMLKKCKLEMK